MNIDKRNIMTFEEAKEFYFQYNGFSFHMDREEPRKYNDFRMLDIEKDILKKWDEELLDDCFKSLLSAPDRVWISHGNILKIIRRNNCDARKYLSLLLDEMEKMEDLDLSHTTLIIENMAGRTEPMTDGGVYTFCKYPDLAKRMGRVMERLIDRCSAKYKADERFEEAVRRYRRSYDTWRPYL